MTLLRAVMVDLDGTLARTVDANWYAYAQALKEAGVTITRWEFESRYQGRNWREFLPEILEEANVKADPEQIALRKTELYRTSLLKVEINWPLVQVVETNRSHGMRTALVTSASAPSVSRILSAHNLARLFDAVVTGDDVQNHKPHPEPYQLAADQLGVKPEECLVYEDSDTGTASALRFGASVLRISF